MDFVTITKKGRTKKMSLRAWENHMPKDKDGWEIKPEAPKEVSKGKKEIKPEAPKVEVKDKKSETKSKQNEGNK
jgi:hypothetical protein